MTCTKTRLDTPKLNIEKIIRPIEDVIPMSKTKNVECFIT